MYPLSHCRFPQAQTPQGGTGGGAGPGALPEMDDGDDDLYN